MSTKPIGKQYSAKVVRPIFIVVRKYRSRQIGLHPVFAASFRPRDFQGMPGMTSRGQLPGQSHKEELGQCLGFVPPLRGG